MSLGGSSQPKPVDPTALANAQTQSNLTTAQAQAALNNATVNSPYGTTSWTPSTNAQGQTTYTLNEQLSPQLQALYGAQLGLAGNITNAAGALPGAYSTLTGYGQGLLGQAAGVNVPTSLNLSGVPGISTLTPQSFVTNVNQGPVQGSVSSNFPQLVSQAQNAAYNSQTQYLDPQWNQAQSNLTQQLADQGIQEGTPAYSRAMLDFNNQKQQAYGNAQYQAVQAGNQQQQALFGESLGAGEFANQAQQQLFGQNLQQADLYNQAVLGSTNQQNTAVGLGLSEAQAQAQFPLQALEGLTSAGSSIYGTGLGSLAQAAGFTNMAPTWPLSIPTQGGEQTTIQPTNYAFTQSAATGANQLANSAFNNNLTGLGSLGNLGSQALFGQSLGGALGGNANSLFGATGLFGGLFGAGSNAATAGAVSSLIPGLGAASGGGGLLASLPGLAAAPLALGIPA